MMLHPEYGRFVAALQGVLAPGVADQGLIHGAAPASSSATMRAETSAYKSRFMSTRWLKVKRPGEVACHSRVGPSGRAHQKFTLRGYLDRPPVSRARTPGSEIPRTKFRLINKSLRQSRRHSGAASF